MLWSNRGWVRLLLGVGWAWCILAWAPWSPVAGNVVRGDGLIIAGRPAGVTGPQMDAQILSPAPRRFNSPVLLEQTHTVQPGETLSGIAARYGLDLATLSAANGLTRPDRLEAGRVLRIAATPIATAQLPADGPVAHLRAWPWPPAQGQTLVIWLRLNEAGPVAVSLDADRALVVADGQHAWALLPIAPNATPGLRQLIIASAGVTATLPTPLQPTAFAVQQIPASASDPILSQPVRVNAEYERMTALFASISAGGWTPQQRFRLPLTGQPERTSPFGTRRTYGAGAELTPHLGEDFAAAPGTPVLAPAPAVVVLAEPLFVRGNAVVLDHGRGVFTGYWHLQSIAVAVGDRVTTGQKIGEVGSTGLSSGPHLHWEMRVAGVAVDPLQWVAEQAVGEK